MVSTTESHRDKSGMRTETAAFSTDRADCPLNSDFAGCIIDLSERMKEAVMKVYHNITELIGHTPLEMIEYERVHELRPTVGEIGVYESCRQF